jgi:hypothetical protein
MHTLKGYESQINKLNGEIELIKKEIKLKNQEKEVKIKAISGLKSQIAKLKNNSELVVSEHAILRYLERVEKIDISEIEKKIKTEKLVKLVEQLGNNGSFPIDDEYSVKIKDGVIVTVII